MSNITQIQLPRDQYGNDPNDHINDPKYLDKITPIHTPILNQLDKFTLNGASEDMKAQMLGDKYILGRMAILGQSTAIYAEPNAGKTLMTIWLLVQSIKSGQINASDIYYVNADDHFKGLAYKLSIAEKHGFKMLAPGHKGFKREMLLVALDEMVITDTAQGKIVIMDTLKKFTDIMDKRIATKFGEAIRQFVSKGGSIIMLAHVNKHKNADGKVIFSGTSDIVDDSDCCYTLEVIDKNSDNKVIEFNNFKDRGDVVKKALFSYSNKEGVLYGDLIDSIVELDDGESKRIAVRNIVKTSLVQNHDIIEAVKDAITNGITSKTELVKQVKDETGESRKRVLSVLKEHTGTNEANGHLWTSCNTGKNKIDYRLISPVFNS